MPIEQPLKLQLDYPETVFNDYEEDLQSTDIFSYDTILFDLDGTVWDIISSDEKDISAADTKGPYQLLEGDIILARDGVRIFLHPGFWEFLTLLVEEGISLGVVSSSKSASPDKDPTMQPAFQLLEKFDLGGYFDAGIVIEHSSIPKSRLVNRIAKGKTLLIDNELDVLQDVEEESNVDVLPRWTFPDYYELVHGLGNGLSRIFVISLGSTK